MTLKEGIKPVAINYCPEAPLNQSSGSSRVGSLEAVTVSFSDGRIIYYSMFVACIIYTSQNDVDRT